MIHTHIPVETARIFTKKIHLNIEDKGDKLRNCYLLEVKSYDKVIFLVPRFVAFRKLLKCL